MMKKLFTLIATGALLLSLNAQTNYYISETGNSQNDGLTVNTAFATLKDADNAITTAELASPDTGTYIVNIDGTVMGGESCVFHTSKATKIIIKGSGADSSAIQMCSDEEYAAIADAGRFFQLTDNKCTNIILEIEDLTIKNWGFDPNGTLGQNGGTLFNQKNDTIRVSRCNILRGRSRHGVICQMFTANANFFLTDSYISELTSYNNNDVAPPLLCKQGSLSVTNCVFNNNTKDYTKQKLAISDNEKGSVIFCEGSGDTKLTVVNNTFINNKIYDPAGDEYEIKKTQSVISISPTNTISGVVANNIFTGNIRDNSTDVDIFLKSGHDDKITGLSIINNVANSMDTSIAASNDVDSSYSYNSQNVAFAMKDSLPEIFTTNTGVIYVKAGGTSIFAKANTDYAPATDITGELRATAPSLGAYDATEASQPSSIRNTESNLNFEIYPNPTSSRIINIVGLTATSDVTIYNTLGQCIKSVNTTNKQLNLQDVPTGIYIISVYDNNKMGTQTLILK